MCRSLAKYTPHLLPWVDWLEFQKLADMNIYKYIIFIVMLYIKRYIYNVHISPMDIEKSLIFMIVIDHRMKNSKKLSNPISHKNLL